MAPAPTSAGAYGPPLTCCQAAMLAAVRPMLGTVGSTVASVQQQYLASLPPGGYAGVPAPALADCLAALANAAAALHVALHPG